MEDFVNDVIFFFQNNPLFVLAFLFFAFKYWQSKQPFPEYEGSKVVKIETVAQYDELLQSTAAGKQMLVIDFYATWCPPCRTASPVYGKMSTEYDASKVVFAKVDVDKCREVASKNGISAMPTFKFYENGVETKTLTGWRESEVRQTVKKSGAPVVTSTKNE